MNDLKAIAIMQPYFLPYLGYFQLIHAVDCFYLLDDVAMIKQGWVQRNRILEQGEPRLFQLPLQQLSQNRLIMQHELHEPEQSMAVLRKRFHHAYCHAPHYLPLSALLDELCTPPSSNLVDVIEHSLHLVCEYLQLPTPIIRVSSLGAATLSGQDRILALCHQVHADHYFNLPGGQALYDESSFQHAHIQLSFLLPQLKPYPQKSEQFHPGLSILDLMMNLDQQQLQKQLLSYRTALPILQTV